MPTDGGEAVSGGLEVLVLGEDGPIKTDYMFPAPDPMAWAYPEREIRGQPRAA